MQQIPAMPSSSLRRLEEFDSVVESMNCNTSMPPPPSSSHPQTLYMPIESPPTPAPSPGPHAHPTYATPPSQHLSLNPLGLGLASMHRRQFLSAVLASCTPSELLYISTTIAPLLKRDFLFSLPPELASHALSFIDEPRTLARAAQVSKYWGRLVDDEWVWKRMCVLFGFDDWERDEAQEEASRWRTRKGKQKESPRSKLVRGLMQDEDDEPLEEMEQFAMLQMDPALEYLAEKRRKQRQLGGHPQSPITKFYPRPRYRGGDTTSLYRQHFRDSYITMANWRQGGSMLRIHRHPVITSDSGVVTSLALDSDWIVVGLASSNIHVFSARTGVLARTLVGHDLGVWCVALVSKGGWMDRKSGREKHVNGDGTRRNSTSTGNAADAEPSTSSTIPPPDDDDDGEWTRGGAGIAAHAQQRRRRSMRSLHTDFRGMDISGSVSVTNTARTPIPSAEGLDRHLPPALRTALGLDDEGEGSDGGDNNGKRSEVFNEDAPPGSNEDEGPTPDPGKRSDANFTSQGWGQPNALVVSGGCDKMVRVWDIKSGRCIYVLAGHTSTTRCIRVLHNRPVAVSGSRDGTLRVWDIQRGRCLRVLRGHQDSVRCLDVCGNIVVSGSYDTTCRVWNADTGECVHVLTGHFHQIYSVAFDGVRIASGGLDTTVRLWDVKTGECLAILNGHTALVCQLQLSSTILATGGSDGRVITFSLESPYDIRHRIAAHDSSVTSLQFDKNFLVTGGNDGRVRLYEIETAAYIRDLSEPSESVWKVGYSKDICAVMCRRAGKTVMEIWSMRPREDQ